MTEKNTTPETIVSGSAEPVGYVTGSNLRAMKDGLQGVMTVSQAQNAVFQNPLYAEAVTVDRDRAAFDLAKAILECTEGEWEPSIAQSHEILAAVLDGKKVEADV